MSSILSVFSIVIMSKFIISIVLGVAKSCLFFLKKTYNVTKHINLKPRKVRLPSSERFEPHSATITTVKRFSPASQFVHGPVDRLTLLKVAWSSGGTVLSVLG
jgi:hypothetical protein